MTRILIILALFIGLVSFGQINKCDTIYDFAEQMPQYINDSRGLMDFFNKELIPIISDCMKRDSSLIASLQIVLTIDIYGQVINATFPKPELTDLCKSNLKKKLITMKGWKPGQMSGMKVCTHFYWPISCIKWE